jgi:glyoxylase-like metal-dependent hydrolase (beta-lactamase superfamily II)
MQPIVFGHFALYPIETGHFRLDGGAMFGVVPKVLWSKYIPADENNRILMGMRCLLVVSKTTGRVYLIDCGLGTKFDTKQLANYCVDFSATGTLLDNLKKAGFSPDDITDLVLTHLHFDHVGGATVWENGKAVPQFKNARFHVTESHWQIAIKPNQREKASFFTENLEPLEASGRLVLWHDAPIYENGFDALIMNGHTIGQQLPRLHDGEKRLIFAGDLIPTYAHVPLPWVMGYDMQPLVTLEEKSRFLQENANINTWIFLEHDAEHEVIQLQLENGRYAAGARKKLFGAFSNA